MNVWMGIVLAALGSYLLRLLPLELLGRIPTPAWIYRAGRVIGPVAFAAMAASAIPAAAWTPAETAARLVAVGVAALVAVRTRSTLATLASGMGALWVVSAVLTG